MSRADLASRVARRLQDSIMRGVLSEGERVEPERVLAAEYGVSRSVVREALERLESLGLVERRQGSGTRVTRPNDAPITTGYTRLMQLGQITQRDLEAVRLPLEIAMVRLAATHRTEADLAALDRQQEALITARSLVGQVRADVAFHNMIARSSRNRAFSVVLNPIQDLLIETRRRTLKHYTVGRTHAMHQRIVDAIRAHDPDEAEQAMRDHLPRISEAGEFLPLEEDRAQS